MAFKLNSTALNILRVFAAALVFFCHSTIVARDCFGLELSGLSRLIITPAWGGVWIFLVTGGILAAYGFDSQKYLLNKDGIQKYYKSRIIKVLLPTWIFLSLGYIFKMEESYVSLTGFLRILTCTFNAGGGVGTIHIKGVGASWYVFIIMWLYLLTPLLLKGLHRFEGRHQGHELKGYMRLIAVLCCVGVLYRFCGYLLWLQFDERVYYNWFYANVTGTVDLFAIGMIGERMMHYIPKISDDKIYKFRKLSLWAVLIVACLFLGNYKYQRVIYLFMAPSMFAISTIFMIMVFSYKSDTVKSRLEGKRIAIICNALAPYAFMFYLWHSPLLGYVADKLKIEDLCIHYYAMLVIGGVVTAYVSYLMTTMNQGITKKLLRKSE